MTADDRRGRRDEIALRAQRALAEAERRGIPPEPRAFELFYAYLEGRDGALVAAVDAMLSPGEGANLDALERIYHQHLAPGDRVGRYAELGDLVERELEGLDRSLGRQAEAERTYADRLRAATRSLGLLPRPAGLKRAARELSEAAEAHAERAAALRAELDAARAQVAAMREELRDLRERAYLDHLTGLANRRRFDAALEAEIAARRVRGAFSVVLCDLDHFKRVNDRFGHGVGDSVLRRFAEIIRQNVQGKDVPARYGGEEFALILPMTELLGARHVAERIRQALASRAFVISGTRRPLGAVTASFGVAEHRAGESARALLQRVDGALYRAKATGRNRVAAAD